MQKIQSKIIDRGSKLSDDEVDCNPDNKQITVAFLFSHGDHGIHLYPGEGPPNNPFRWNTSLGPYTCI